MNMKRITALALCLVLAVGLLPAGAAAASPDRVVSFDLTAPTQYWKTTQAARVVSNRGDALVVNLNNPGKLAVQEGDSAQSLQVIPITKEVAVTDSQGGQLSLEQVLPGQEVKVTFRFCWREGSPRSLQMDYLTEIALTGDALEKKSAASVNDLKKDSMVAVVLEQGNGELYVYAEAAKAVSGGTEYIVSSPYRLQVFPGTTVLDSDGTVIPASRLQAYDRVYIEVGEAVWAESYPPIYAPQNAARIQLLGPGEGLYDCGELANANRVTGTVKEIGTDENGQATFVLVPQAGSRQAALAGQYTVYPAFGPVILANGSQGSFQDLQPGMTVEITYNGIRYDGSAGTIPWYNQIRVAA